eukprot:423512_1
MVQLAHYLCTSIILLYTLETHSQSTFICNAQAVCSAPFPYTNPYVLTCSNTGPCNIQCIASNACQSSIITCPDSYGCSISCQGGSMPLGWSCNNAVIHCGNVGCDIDCVGHQACNDALINCPPNAKCNVTCTDGVNCPKNGINYLTEPPTLIPTTAPTIDTYQPTISPTFEICFNQYSESFNVSFNYIENAANLSKSQLNDVLLNITDKFIQNEMKIHASTEFNCVINDEFDAYRIVDIREDIKKAFINITICVECDGTYSVLTVDNTNEIEKDFLDRVEQETQIISVIANSTVIAVKIEPPSQGIMNTGVLQSTEDMKYIGRKDNGNNMFWRVMVSVFAVILLFVAVLCFLLVYKVRKDRKMLGTKKNDGTHAVMIGGIKMKQNVIVDLNEDKMIEMNATNSNITNENYEDDNDTANMDSNEGNEFVVYDEDNVISTKGEEVVTPNDDSNLLENDEFIIEDDCMTPQDENVGVTSN